MSGTTRDPRPIDELWPALRRRLPLVSLLAAPTAVQHLSGVDDALWIKRDDLSAAAYGGNKVRTLEVLFGDARARGATHIYASGAYGSNHAVATLLHAERAGLSAGALLFEQPPSGSALDNLRVILARACDARPTSFAMLPWLAYRLRREHRARAEKAYVMAPGGASMINPVGTPWGSSW